MVDTQVFRLEAQSIEQAAELIPRTFSCDPLFTYLLPPTDDSRLRKLKEISIYILRYSYAKGVIYTTAEPMKGIAAWTPPSGGNSFNLFELVELLQAGFLTLPFQLGLETLWRQFQLSSEILLWAQRPRKEPHWYLSVLGVAPEYQRQGIGSALLQPILAQADSQGLPCYLDTFVERNLQFYGKQGFEVVTTIDLPISGLRYWIMKREPRRS